MDVIFEKPMRKGEERQGRITRELNGKCFFEEEVNPFTASPRKTRLLKQYPSGTKVKRKGLELRITLVIDKPFDTLQELELTTDLCDAVSYSNKYLTKRTDNGN